MVSVAHQRQQRTEHVIRVRVRVEVRVRVRVRLRLRLKIRVSVRVRVSSSAPSTCVQWKCTTLLSIHALSVLRGSSPG